MFLLMSISEEFVLSMFVTFGLLKVVQLLFELVYPRYKLWLEDASSIEDNYGLSRGFVYLFWLDILLSLIFVCKKGWKMEKYRLSEDKNENHYRFTFVKLIIYLTNKIIDENEAKKYLEKIMFAYQNIIQKVK